MNFLPAFLHQKEAVTAAARKQLTAAVITIAYTQTGNATHLSSTDATTLCRAQVTKHGSITDTDEIRFNLPRQQESFNYCGECVEIHTGIHRDLVTATRKQEA